jgi:hypothetical protein
MIRCTSLLSLVLVSLCACQPSGDREITRWNFQQGELPPEVEQQAQELAENSPSSTYKGYSTFLAPSQSRGVSVPGFVGHGVADSAGQWRELSFKQSPQVSLIDSIRARRMHKQLPQMVQRFQRQFAHWKVHNKQVVYFMSQVLDEPVLAYQITAFSPDETDVIRYRFSSTWELLEEQSVAHHLVVGEADVFTGRPDVTEISEQFLPDLMGTGYLKSDRVNLVSALPKTAFSDEHIFRFDPQDERFDDVQAYYFADQAILWFQNQLQQKLPQALEVMVHVGAPRRTNTAFYYDYRVRLGSGDGVTYQHIPRDPSIVSHEVAHAFIQQMSGLPFNGEGGSLNEAFADYFAAEIIGQPEMAAFSYKPGPYRRNLNNQLKFSDLNGSLYGDSLLFSGTLWELRTQLGSSKVLPLATLTLMHLGPYGRLSDFAPILLRVGEAHLSEEDLATVRIVLDGRGLLSNQ